MHKTFSILLILTLTLPQVSCKKLIDYFRNPDTEVLVETLHTTVLAGYAANKAMAVMEGQSFSNVLVSSRSNPGFPCTSIMVIDLTSATDLPFGFAKASAITIAGMWPDESTAVLTLLYTDYHTETTTLDLVGIETIPVVRDGDNIHVALASMDIRLNPDQESILSLNLNTFEVESELFRLEMPRPDDVYIAVLEDAYFIDVNTNGTNTDQSDDSYSVTGGGQLIEIAGNSTEIVQQAMVEVQVSSACNDNPVGGMAIIRVIGVEDDDFPEMGTAVLEFTPDSQGTVQVLVATGMYIGSNGKRISFLL